MPSWRDLKRFCDQDGWELYIDTDLYCFRKESDDGSIRYTKVAKSTDEIKERQWAQILQNQLKVSKEYFDQFSNQ